MPEEELERVYTVPLSRAWIAPRHRRVVRAVNILREFAEKHMKSSEIKIDTKLNEELWQSGITRPPRRITVKMLKDEDGLVTISIPKKKEEETAPTEEEAPKVEEPALPVKDAETKASTAKPAEATEPSEAQKKSPPKQKSSKKTTKKS